MVITDKFVYIHNPKTGGTFVTTAISRVYDMPVRPSLWQRLRVRLAGKPAYLNLRDGLKHGSCEQIPPEHQQKPILSTIRNPFDCLVSNYEFRHWRRHAEEFLESTGDSEGTKRRYPHFPDLSFAEYCAVLYSSPPSIANQQVLSGESVGPHTHDFIQRFFRSPARVVSTLSAEYLASNRHREDMYPVQFLHTENLRQELHDFLARLGFAPEKIGFILHAEKVFPKHSGERQGRPWAEYYTPELKALVRDRERFLFKLFPEFDAIG